MADACAELDRAGLPLIVVTNQPDIARGRSTRADVDAFNAALRSQLPITAVVVCPHDDGDDCACRKPRPGMLVESAAALGFDLAASVMVGDRWRDIAAGRAAGTSTVFVDHGYAESARADVAADLTVPALLDAVPYILDRSLSSEQPIHDAPHPTSRVKIFADGADLDGIRRLAADPMIQGITTNPTLMRAAGVADYEAFAHDVLAAVGGKPVSFEVLSDDFDEMEKQALRIGAWADNVYVKIPVTNTKGERTATVLRNLASSGVRVNVTAVFTPQQVAWILDAHRGRPAELRLGVRRAHRRRRRRPDPRDARGPGRARVRPRHRVDLGQPSRGAEHRPGRRDRLSHHHRDARPAQEAGRAWARISTQFSLETVQMFRRDAEAAGYTL